MKNQKVHAALDSLIAAAGGSRFEDVPIGEGSIPVRPVTIIEAVRVIKRFPALLAFFEEDESGKTANIGEILVDAGPDAVAAFVACSLGAPGDRDAEERVAAMPDDVLLPLVTAALKRTLGDEGIEGFFTKLGGLMEASGLLKAPSDAKAA